MNYCDITILLDKSGSMEGVKSDTIGGINSFIDEQKKVGGKCKVSLHQFDDFYETTYSNVDIAFAPKLNNENYKTRGWTALLDAIGKTVNNLGERLNALSPQNRPNKVIVLIQTDGYENRSTEFKPEAIKNMIKHQTDKYSWEFVFLGANIDAIGTARAYGIKASSAMNYADNSVGTQNLYKSLSSNVTKFRNGAPEISFSTQDRAIQDEEISKIKK